MGGGVWGGEQTHEQQMTMTTAAAERTYTFFEIFKLIPIAKKKKFVRPFDERWMFDDERFDEDERTFHDDDERMTINFLPPPSPEPFRDYRK